MCEKMKMCYKIYKKVWQKYSYLKNFPYFYIVLRVFKGLIVLWFLQINKMTHQSLVKLEDWIKIQVQLKYRFFFHNF